MVKVWEFFGQLGVGFQVVPQCMSNGISRQLSAPLITALVGTLATCVNLLPITLLSQNATGYYGTQVPCVPSMQVGLPINRQDSPDSGINGKLILPETFPPALLLRKKRQTCH